MSDVHPLVSIIVAIYNVEDYLEQCLDSIVAQSFSNIEILLVDDGSSDRSFEICSQYATLDDRIILLHQDNSGVTEARNRGLRSASGDWIMFVDGDDWLTQNAVETLYRCATQENDCDISIGLYYRNYTIPSQQECYIGDTSTLGQTFIYHSGSCTEGLILYALTKTGLPELSHINCNPHVPWAKLYRHSMINSNKLLFISGLDKWEDRIFNLYAFQDARKIVVINAPVSHYRFRPDSVIHQFNGIDSLAESVNIWVQEVKKFLDDFPENTDDIFARFLYVVLITVVDYFIVSRDLGSLSRRETLKNIRLLFNRRNYRDMIQIISANRKNEYFTRKSRIAIAMFRTRSYFLYLASRQLVRRTKARPTV